jgi:hypothetical protein
MCKNCKKFTAEKKSDISLSKNCNLLIPRPPQKTSKLQEKPSAQFLNFFYIFLGNSCPPPPPGSRSGSELEFLKSLWGLGTEEEEGYRTGQPGYIGWRNSFLGIDSGAPYTFKNTGSGFRPWIRIQ